MRRGIAILRDQFRYLSLLDLLALAWSALFKSENVLIYCVQLQGLAIGHSNETKGPSIVKGELADLDLVRKRLVRFPWEFKCDLYDGVKDHFVFVDDKNGTIGHISWLYYSGDPNRTLRLGERECEVMFCFTLPEYRGRGLYPSALQVIQRYLKERGYERCFICVSDDNLASIRGIEKSGFRRVGRTRLRKVFGFQINRRCETTHLNEA